VEPGKAANYGDGITEPYRADPRCDLRLCGCVLAGYLLNPASLIRD